jgi:hypothetical protein
MATHEAEGGENCEGLEMGPSVAILAKKQTKCWENPKGKHYCEPLKMKY